MQEPILSFEGWIMLLFKITLLLVSVTFISAVSDPLTNNLPSKQPSELGTCSLSDTSARARQTVRDLAVL